MQNILVNDDFGKSIQRLRSILPKLSFGLLISTYVISAVIMGIFHAQNAPNIGFMVAAFLVPLAIQVGRGTLVFFFQLNPANIQRRFSFGFIAATALLILSIVEAWLVLSPYGFTWIVSVSSLMLIGWVIEIMILRETIFATQIELFRNRDGWQEVKSFYVARNELQQFVDDLKNGEAALLPAANLPEEQELTLPDPPQEEDKTLLLLGELKTLLEGNALSPSLNGQAKG
ncbi:hypothetical protein [Flavilitoribacter nigricans]|uniref:Uncharacterized protein n=1 Tax=Flavilitoribacter nigricans (strain ATCC 23147 / DSM 23189 / NBRC 102662 / NCIMB 1420 / SS-2) TaxID=1122177 RepID=A0A2D0N975_FLAN2|nr:hypothetical protein [Flavilitoribacter nigricans]PHN04333.1 hypothetical protein CRP01_22490 [Flavilitoribacter nigricans DSM 23189 = NBRC 102662]